jgi:hypothetical protein
MMRCMEINFEKLSDAQHAEMEQRAAGEEVSRYHKAHMHYR